MKLVSLTHAIRQHVLPGMVLHFGSTPSRSNASILELVRQFRERRPQFTLCATGFHSSAHLLSLFRLGERLIGCFYGDNYPQPRPNGLYQTLHDEGTVLEHWSLLNYVLALRAGAMGQLGTLTRSLAATSLGPELARHGRYRELQLPAAGSNKLESCGVLAPLSPDLSFLHAAVADEHGHAWFWPPHSEGFHGALAARRGVVLSVDQVLPSETVLAHPELIPIPANRVLAVVHAPFGAHPQPVHCGGQQDTLSYRDDFDSYLWWRRLTHDRALLADFERQVLEADDVWGAYRAYVGHARLETLRSPARRASGTRSAVEPQAPSRSGQHPLEAGCPAADLATNFILLPGERVVVLAARYLAQRIEQSQQLPCEGIEAPLDCMLAGIGQAFAAARLSKVLLAARQLELELMVETGFTGFGMPGDAADTYLLSQRNIALSTRLTDVESVLGTLVTGAQNRCIGVIGGAQVDQDGNVNSTLVNGKLLVGSGGACDIALGAREVLVLARRERLVPRVQYITSPGERVRAVVVEDGVLERCSGGWTLHTLGLAPAPEHWKLPTIPWSNLAPPTPGAGSPVPGSTIAQDRLSASLSTLELDFIEALRAEARAGTSVEHNVAERSDQTQGARCTA